MTGKSFLNAIEWPTLMLFAGVYGLWALLTWQIGAGAWWPYVFLWLLLTQHSSLQHEVIHGHPTRWQTFNSTLASLAIGLLLPFERFEDLHLKHHRDWLLTDPFDDTESYFMAAGDWRQLSAPHQRLLIANNTLLGRIVLGPWIMYVRLFKNEWKLLRNRSPGVLHSWVKHLIGVTPVLLWLDILGVSILTYLLLAVWPATALLLLRAYAEHLPKEQIEERSAIVSSGKFMGLLYLNNNYHRVHHDDPNLPWYHIPHRYRERYATQSGDHMIQGYWMLFRHHAFRPRYPVAHPVLRTHPNDRSA